ncbi:MAG: bifunctional chorismate mutase/prephenate dehydratase [Oscillospiraceae bacterium]|nr:bifunctional chorismate mutase/prephenate dehydratase [Oscillospiraceae bacterium]
MSELERCRAEIDALDEELVALFLKRMEVTERVGRYKQAHGMPVLDSGREREVIAAKAALTDAPARRADLARLYSTVMAISRAQQRFLVHEREMTDGFAQYLEDLASARTPLSVRPRVAYQGEPGAYSEQAAAEFFGMEAQCTGEPWFEDVFLALRDGRADYAMLPVENSSTGSIRQVYDLLAQYSYFAVGEHIVKVEHCLAALPGVCMEDIARVYSHEQGLMQCERFLNTHPAWQRLPALDTAGSARQLAEHGDRAAAAICSRRAAQLYGLAILAEGINENTENHTRFLAVSPRMELREGRDKIGAILRLPHQSGSLHEILSVFAAQGMNLVKLESRPVPGHKWEYLFFLEFTGDLLAPGMEDTLRELSQMVVEFRILGNFGACE